MTQQSKLTTDLEVPVLEYDPKNNGRKPVTKTSLLKTLREKKKVSRTHLSKLTSLSVYQVEGLEGPGAQNMLDRFLNCTKALGYKAGDILSMMEQGSGPSLLKGTIGKPLFETHFREGVKSQTHLNQNGNFLGLLQLAMGRSVEMKQIHTGDIVFGIVREGTLVIDLLMTQTVHKKDSFFILPGNLPIQFFNNDVFVPAAALLFSVKFPA